MISGEYHHRVMRLCASKGREISADLETDFTEDLKKFESGGLSRSD